MKPKGEHENEIRALLEALEDISSQYRKISESTAVRRSAARRKNIDLAKHGHVLTIWKNHRRSKKTRKQNNQMRARMAARETQVEYKADARKEYFSNHRIAVYTALFGNYDEVREPLIRPDNIDYFIVTDQDVAENSLYHRLPAEIIPKEADTNIAKNRWAKMHPHVLFPDYDYSIYLDANCWVVSDLTPLIATLGSFPVAMFPHKNRDCVYDEITACLTQAKDDPRALELHRQVLIEHGVPKQTGLLEATVIARRHHDSESIALMKQWWQSFCACSNRDQISLVDCLWQMGIPIEQLATLQNCGAGKTVPTCSLFIPALHRSNTKKQ